MLGEGINPNLREDDTSEMALAFYLPELFIYSMVWVLPWPAAGPSPLAGPPSSGEGSALRPEGLKWP